MKPCSNCGGTDRNNSGDCRPCQAARYAKWLVGNADKEKARKAADYQANREKLIARAAARYEANRAEISVYKAAWNRANRDKRLGYSAKWRANHPEQRKQVVKSWEARNPEAVLRGRHNRRARIKSAPGKLSRGLLPRLFKLQRGKCACCGLPLGLKYEIDHVTPLALGGSNADNNTQLLRAACNRKKSAKHPVDYMQSLGYLL